MAIRLFGRLLSLGLFVAVAAVVWPALQRQRALQEATLAELEQAQEEVAAELERLPEPAPPAPAAEPERARGERTYYRYLDAGGSLHFVDSLERVPEGFRASAKPIALAGDSGSSSPPTPSRRAAAPPARHSRPFERAASLPAAQRPAPAAGVVVYTTSWCGWCRKTLAWLDERGVDYENRDIERSDAWRDELVEKTGSVSIPVVEIDGQIVRGYDPGRMGELL
jgi:glutaredoxin